MKSRKVIIIIVMLLFAAAAIIGICFFNKSQNREGEAACVPLRPSRGDISLVISCNGTIEPRNRLEIKPAISGRVEKILVDEGYNVRAGQIVAWMSSEERAALIDAARAQGKDSVKYWEETYKPIPLLSPIAGTIIVRDIEPGQSVTSSSVILVVSDRLIVRAVVDETDIGKIRSGQRARVSLDAYPEVIATGSVVHISYESTVVNNVTTYEVDIIPERVPDVFRSGMTADISIIQTEKKNVMTLPLSAVSRENGRSLVTVVDEKTGRRMARQVTTGITDDSIIEIVSGLSSGDSVCMASDNLVIPASKNLDSPFLPKRPGKKK